MTTSATPASSPRNALAAALLAAGYRPPAERLRGLAEEALKSAAGNMPAAMARFSKIVRSDPELLWELFAAQRDDVVLQFLRNTAAELRRPQTPKRKRGQESGPVLEVRGRAVQGGTDRPASPSSPKPMARPNPQRHTAWKDDAVKSLEADRRNSKLYTFQINGKPIAEITASEAAAWANARDRDSYFVRLLIDGVPPDMLIGKARTPEEADRLYQRAEASSRA